MRAALLLLVLSACIPARAQKQRPSYQDATVKSFRMVQAGRSCSTSGDTTGTVNATTDSDGNTNGNIDAHNSSRTTCRPTQKALYTLNIGEQTIVVTPKVSIAKAGAVILTLGIAGAFMKNSALYGQLPGAVVKIRSDGAGSYLVKVGKRESGYSLVSAE